MIQQVKKFGTNKVVIALAALGGVLLLKRIFRNRSEEKRGYCESLGEKIDQGLGCLAVKVGEFVDPKRKN